MAILGPNTAQGVYNLTRPLLRQNPVQPSTTQVSRKAPIKGWNTRDSRADMDIGYAIQLDNWIPREDVCQVRPGRTEHATGAGTAVDTLMALKSPTQDKLLAASGGVIYDVTSTGSATSIGTGYTNAKWQHVNANGYLLAVNGDDTPIYYDGSSITNLSITGSGLTASNLIGINSHANRLWFVEKDALDPWYLDVENIQGTATKFRIAYYTQLGGYLMAIGTWSRDGGAGPDDYIVFVTSEGEVLVYSGISPASDFQLIGRYAIGKPIGRRCMMKLGAELVVLTQDGYVNLSAVLGTERAYINRAISDPIRPTIRDAYRDYSTNHGWQAIQWADQNIVLVNVPTSEGSAAEQHVVNTITGAWCRFTDLPMVSMATVGDDLYFGNGAGSIQKMTGSDRSDAGSAISAIGAPAFDYLNARGRLKQMQLQRHQLQSDGDFTATFGMDVNFLTGEGAESTITITATAGGAWDTSDWDTTDWGKEVVSNAFVGASGNAYSFSPRLEVSTNNVRPSWIAYDLVWTNGGVM